ncbi:MAG: phage integrase N-terminal SAM-like domain-containing protein [Spirochaetaceae bacterium]|jgi:integrase|nr:phage integrase N-terminal SAM-like domain-containing protein [Spirochaetaceae bacterium]
MESIFENRVTHFYGGNQIGTVDSDLFNGVNRGVGGSIGDCISGIQEVVKNNPLVEGKLNLKIATDIVIDERRKDYHTSLIDINKELENFISIQTSKKTGKVYSGNIKDFFRWCDTEGIDNPLKITRSNVDGYLVYLMSEYSNNTTRNKIMSVCSFYKFLIYRYTDLFHLNPFHDLKLPPKRLKNKTDWVTEKDITELRKELVKGERPDILCCVDLVTKYGFRVGIFEKMEIDTKRNWTSESKGTSYKGKFTKKEVGDINTSGLLNVKREVISSGVRRYTQKLFKKGMISCGFSIHDLRHYYITKKGKDLTVENFIKFSRTVHRNVNTTIGYMNV